MSDCLPNEVLIGILSQLSVKSLIRFRCVCKSWCSLISSTHFIATHLNHSLSNSQHPPYLFLSHYRNRPPNNDVIHSLLLYPDQETGQKGQFFSHPSDCTELRGINQSTEYFLHLVGSSNGLLCLANMVFNNESGICVLWNPSIQKAISLPLPNIVYDKSLNQSVGFGYDPMSDDYKLVRLVYHGLNTDIVPPLVEIYTLRTRKWRSITAAGPPYVMNMWMESVFLNGAVHWSAHTPRSRGGFRNVIVSFNMKDEAFGEMGMPKSLEMVKILGVTVGVVDGLLALFPWKYDLYCNDASQAVWVMTEYGVADSWTKLFDVRIGGFEKVIGFAKSGEVLVHKAGRLFSFQPGGAKGYLDLPIRGIEEIYLDTYVESLVLLNVEDGQGNSCAGS